MAQEISVSAPEAMYTAIHNHALERKISIASILRAGLKLYAAQEGFELPEIEVRSYHPKRGWSMREVQILCDRQNRLREKLGLESDAFYEYLARCDIEAEYAALDAMEHKQAQFVKEQKLATKGKPAKIAKAA